jgi:hypothetical protein
VDLWTLEGISWIQPAIRLMDLCLCDVIRIRAGDGGKCQMECQVTMADSGSFDGVVPDLWIRWMG